MCCQDQHRTRPQAVGDVYPAHKSVANWVGVRPENPAMKSSLFLSTAFVLALKVTTAFGAAMTTTTATANVSCSGATKFELFGVNESGAEFGSTTIPGVLGTDYTWPVTTSIDVSGSSYIQY